jgi:dihydrofolate reductase
MSDTQLKLIMYPAVTLDGFIADLSGECYSWINDEDEAEYTAAMRRCGADIVGSKTYEQYREEYDNKTDVMTFVCTNSSAYQDTEKIKFIHGTPEEMVETIKSYGFSEAILSGGGEINGLFATAGLVSEMFISIYPLTLGEGIRLFGSYSPQLKLELLSSQIKHGITQNHYKVVK